MVIKSQFSVDLSYYRGFSSDFPQMTQIDADIISKVQVEICVICVICGQIWVVEIRNPKSEFRNLGAGGQTTVLTWFVC